jgi:hypothetical protein
MLFAIGQLLETLFEVKRPQNLSNKPIPKVEILISAATQPIFRAYVSSQPPYTGKVAHPSTTDVPPPYSKHLISLQIQHNQFASSDA